VEEVSDEPCTGTGCAASTSAGGMAPPSGSPIRPARRAAETRSFGTPAGMLALATGCGLAVPAVVMEATGDYWKGPFYGWRRGVRVRLADAKQVRHLPAVPSMTRVTRGGWQPASSAARSPPASWPPGVPIIGCTPATGGPDRRADPGEAARGKAARTAAIKLSSVVTDLHGSPAGHHGHSSPGTQPQYAGPAGPRPRPPQDHRLEQALEGAEFFTPGTPRCWPPCWPASTGSTPRSPAIGGDRDSAGTL